MDKYKAFIRLNVRKVIAEKDIDKQRAIDFLTENPDTGVIEDYNGKEYKLEELLNVKNIGSENRDELDRVYASGRTVSEDTYRELFAAIEHRTESSSERDN